MGNLFILLSLNFTMNLKLLFKKGVSVLLCFCFGGGVFLGKMY